MLPKIFAAAAFLGLASGKLHNALEYLGSIN